LSGIFKRYDVVSVDKPMHPTDLQQNWIKYSTGVAKLPWIYWATCLLHYM